jgi:succinate dehydrogenase hydrophobic anchor subunit
MNKIMIPFLVVHIYVAHHWGNEFASKHKIKWRYHKEAMLFYILHKNNLGSWHNQYNNMQIGNVLSTLMMYKLSLNQFV